jgi:teichuronic acid biosynthesis glycosyltransferase TuaG
MSDFVTIIIPNYNSEGTITETLESVRAQTHTTWECIVVDDCSSDSSPAHIEEIIRLDDRIQLIRLAVRSGGPAHPRNVGLEMARGSYIAFLDSDDLWHPQKLDIQLAAMRLHKAKFCSTAMTRFRDSNAIFSALHHVFPLTATLDNALVQRISHHVLLRKNIIPNSSVVAERSIFMNFRFDERPDYRAIEDFHGWLLLHQAKIPFSINFSSTPFLPFKSKLYLPRKGRNGAPALAVVPKLSHQR